eukprot:1470636-Pyramimonas_sp.AAC.1
MDWQQVVAAPISPVEKLRSITCCATTRPYEAPVRPYSVIPTRSIPTYRDTSCYTPVDVP